MEAMFLTVTCQEEVIYILEKSTLCCLSWEASEVGSQGFSKQVWGVFECLRKMGPGQLHLMSHFWVGPLEGKERLALWGQMEAEECVLQVQAGELARRVWDLPQECIWVWDHWVERDGGLVDSLEVLDWPISPICLIYWQKWGVPG
jgi:hypothetical protein